MPMELRRLEYFLAVAEAGHFTRAAESMHVSQPALSQQIKKLEAELGAPLFDRLGRGVELTEAGELLLPRVRRVLSELDDAETAVEELRGLQRGTVRLGTVQTTGEYLIPDAVSRFHEAHPNVNVSVEERSAPGIERGLQEGALDLGIGFVTGEQNGLDVSPLFDESLVVIVGRDHPWSHRSTLPVSALEERPLVLLPEGYCTRRLVDRAFQSAGVQPTVRLELNSIAGILQTVKKTGAATILPRLTLSMTGTSGLTAVSLTDPEPRRTVGLLFSADRYHSDAARALADQIRSKADEHVTA